MARVDKPLREEAAGAVLEHSCLQQLVQGGKLVRQAPALERASLIKGANLLPQKRQEVYRIEDHVGLLVGSTVACDLFGAAADDDVMDIVAGEGHDDRISVMETSNLSRGR